MERYIIRKGGVTVLAAIVVFWANLANAGDLAFPTTEEEIVEALSLKDGKTIYNGVVIVSEAGNIYKIIGKYRVHVRGLEEIVGSNEPIRVGALVHFDFDSAKIKPEAYPLLDEYGKALGGRLSEATLIVAGHTDSAGTDEYNMGLSGRRAKAVKTYLEKNYGIEPDRLTVWFYGESKPIARNDTKEGQSLNRRVEFIRIK